MNSRKTVFSMPEYKFLSQLIDKRFPKKNMMLGVLFRSHPVSYQLAAVPKYRGYKDVKTIKLDLDPNENVYTFSCGKFVFADGLPESCIKEQYYAEGLSVGNNELILHFHSHRLFKHNTELFKLLFKCAVTRTPSHDEDFRNLYNYFNLNIKVPGLKTINEGGTFEQLMINNDLCTVQ